LTADTKTGNVTQAKDPMGNSLTYGYDRLNRMTTAKYTTADNILRTYTYGYDKNSNLTSVTDPNNKTPWSYTELNQLLSAVETVDGVKYTTWQSRSLKSKRVVGLPGVYGSHYRRSRSPV
jgi:YD repeat-containing protein